MIQSCVICKRIYGEKEPYEDKSYTHGYCPECYEKEMRRLKKQMREMGIREIEENPRKDFYLQPGIKIMHRSQLSSIPQWVYVEDIFGNLIAKEKISPRKAFDYLSASARVVSLKEKGENFVVFKVYHR